MSRINVFSPSFSMIPPGIPEILIEPLTQEMPNQYGRRINKFYCFSLLMITLLSTSGRLYAESLNLNLNNQSDIISGFIDVEYFNDDAIYAEGFALELDHDGDALTPGLTIVDGFIEFEAIINADGNLSFGLFCIYGEIPELGLAYDVLLEADVVDFGHRVEGGDPLEFIYEVYDGTAADLFGGAGALGGVILSRTGFKGSFEEDFDNMINGEFGTGVGVIDIAPLQ